MAGYPPPYPTRGDLKAQARAMKMQMKMQRRQMQFQARAMRRNSIVGPLVLVGAGVAFLLVELGRLDWFVLMTWYGRWWPLLLIVAGLFLLAEWTIDQKQQEARAANGLPARGTRTLGGGTVALLILMCFVGASSRVAGHAARWDRNNFHFDFADMDRALGNAHDTDESLVHPIAADGSLTIDNPAGDITVSGISDDGMLHVAIHKQVYSMNDEEAGKKADELKPALNSDARWVTLKVPQIDGGHADLVVELPRGIALTLTGGRGQVRVSGIHAPVTVNSNRGSVDLSGLVGDVTAHIHNDHAAFSAHSITGAVALDGRTGDLNVSDINGSVSMNGDFFGTTHVEHVTGAVHFHTSRTDFQFARLDGEMELDTGSDLRADQIVGPVILTTRQRNITLERVQGAVQVGNRDGSVTVTSTSPLGAVDITNHHGSVEVGLPENAGFTVQASTHRGDLENDFALGKMGSSENPSIDGTVGRGGPMVKIATSDGDVTVRKSSLPPLPPLPPVPPVAAEAPSPAPRGLPKTPPSPRISGAPHTPRVPAPPPVPQTF
jgi:hypothetical protein